MKQLRHLALPTIGGLLATSPLFAEPASCLALIERGRSTLETRPGGHLGDHDAEGRPLTEAGRRRDESTRKVLDLWDKARRQCHAEARQASDPRETARLTAWAYWVEARALDVQQKKTTGCEAYARGIEAVAAIDDRSPHLAILYRRLAFCEGESDGVQGRLAMEHALDLLREAFGERDARLVDAMIDLAIMLPYSVVPSGDLRDAPEREAGSIRERVAALYRIAWDIVQEDPNATPEAIRQAAGHYALWLSRNGGDERAVRVEAEALLARRVAP